MPVKMSGGVAFFDRNIIKRKWRKMNETPIKRAGLLVRKIARRSIKVRKTEKPSPPGEPPRSRAPGHPMKLIFSVPNSWATRAIVGPVGFEHDYMLAPEIHEFGRRVKGTVRVPESTQGRSSRTGRFKKKRKVFAKKMVKYPARPFMRPALATARPLLPALWRNSLR